MTLSQRIRLLSFDDLLTIADTVEKETSRRNDFINCLADRQVKALQLTINTRDLLYRIVTTKAIVPTSKPHGDLTIKDLFALLKKEDWLHIEYLNPRAFLEIKESLIRHKAPLEEYYGVFVRKTVKSAKVLQQQLTQIVDDELYK
ncbi:hypothetical protein [Spirosoma jeollabukense]